jgi:hypothetical protein
MALVSSVNNHGMIKNPEASDFQLHKLLSSLQPDSPFYLPYELIQTIVTKAHAITEYRCYQEYGTCLKDVRSLLNFIKTKAEAGEDSASTVNIVKTCLDYSGKELCSIQNKLKETVFHEALKKSSYKHLKKNGAFDYCINVLCQAAGEDLVNLLSIKDDDGLTPWQHAVYNNYSKVVKKFIELAGDRKLELISMKNDGTALDLARLGREDLLDWISNPQYTSCVFKYWAQINELNIIIALLESYYEK